MSVTLWSHLTREIVMTEGSTCGLCIGMSKKEAYEALVARYSHRYFRTRDNVPTPRRPAGLFGFHGDLAVSDHWDVSKLDTAFIERHVLFFQDGKLTRVITQYQILMPTYRTYIGPEGTEYSPY